MTDVMPTSVGIRFAHAAVQAIAEDCGVDVLHIKGPAVDERLLQQSAEGESAEDRPSGHPVPRRSVDADVLVRPSQVTQLVDAMRRHGWSTQFAFEDGSAFEHASTMAHQYLAPMDVHRGFPGIGLESEAAFDRLWADRHTVSIAGYTCGVPSIAAQRVLLLLHAARGGVKDNADVQRCWFDLTDSERAAVDRLGGELRAEVALAAATGRLHRFAMRRDHDLWQALSSGESSLVRIWAARVRAEPTLPARVRTALRLVQPHPHRYERALGRRLTAQEVRAAYYRRAKVGLRELGRLLRDRLKAD